MEVIALLLQELKAEAITTRKMLSRIPPEKFDWQPHPKSMTLKHLATHVAELPTWITMALTTNELNFAANPYAPKDVKNTGEILDFFEESLKSGKQSLEAANINTFTEEWILRNGDEVYDRDTRYGVIRVALSQIIHHRAQLGVYLRLLDIPIPGSYGPSADEVTYQFA
jgi:uncharacterized damage-inducible protein DinB